MVRFRLVHASDFHIGLQPYQVGIVDTLSAPVPPKGVTGVCSTHDPNLIEAFVQFLYQSEDSFDCILLSGDLSSSGAVAELQQALSLVDSPPVAAYLNANNQPTLAGLQVPVLVLPGNHDRYHRFAHRPPFAPGAITFDGIFHAYWPVGQGVHQLLDVTRNRCSLAIISADFTLQHGHYRTFDPFWHLGRGCAYDGLAQLLGPLIAGLRARPTPIAIILALHFEPQVASHLLELVDEHHLEGVLQQRPVDAILCGHTHELTQKAFAGIQVFGCGTTSQYFSPCGHTFLILDVDVDEQSGRVATRAQWYAFDVHIGGFIAAPSP